jgi:acyl-CoA thioester hydrolase
MFAHRQETISLNLAAALDSAHRQRTAHRNALVAALPRPLFMSHLHDVLQLRVRYSETDQMGTFYNSRALEWFECGRTELMRRQLGLSYAELEARGVFLPLIEAHLEFQGGARYDDLLDISSTVAMDGRAKIRFDAQITQNAGRRPVVRGYTVHVFADGHGKPIRPPAWFLELMQKAAGPAPA